MKVKSILVFLCAFLFALTTVSGAVGDIVSPKAQSLSIKQAIEMAMKDNSEAELAQLGVDKAALAVEKAEFTKKKMLDQLDNPERADQAAALVINVTPVQANSNKIIADVKKVSMENSIRYQVEAAYYAVIKAEKNLEVVKSSYLRAQEQEKQAQAKFNTGTVAKIDVISAEAQLKSAQASVNDAQTALDKAKMNFNKTIGSDLNTPINLLDNFSFESYQPIDVEKVFQAMNDKDLTFVSARESLNFNQVNFDYYNKYYTSSTFAYREAAYLLKDAEVNFDTANTTLQLNIKTAYLDLKTAEDNYYVYTKSLEQAKEAYKLTSLQYNAGMATAYDVLSAEDDFKQADLGVINALYNYNLAKAKFAYGVF